MSLILIVYEGFPKKFDTEPFSLKNTHAIFISTINCKINCKNKKSFLTQK